MCHSLSVELSNITWALRELINQLSGNACGSYGTKATIKGPHNKVICFNNVKQTGLCGLGWTAIRGVGQLRIQIQELEFMTPASLCYFLG